MKYCTKCNKKFDDNSKFCDECGSQLVNCEIIFCTNCGCQCTTLDTFCKKCGTPLKGGTAEQPTAQKEVQSDIKNDIQTPSSPSPVQSQVNRVPSNQTDVQNHVNNEHPPVYEDIPPKKNNNAILVAIIGVLAILFAVIVIILIKFGLFPTPNSTKENNNVSSEQTQNVESAKEENSKKVLTLDEYQNYYDNADDNFNKYIISSSQKGELKSYKDSLADAISSKNLDNCQYNYEKLTELEKTLKDDSESKIESLVTKIQKYEKKSKCAKTKKSTEYKKNKELAKNALDKDDYLNANTYYKACLDALKKAASKKTTQQTSSSSSSSNSGKNDSWYENGIKDDSTYNKVYLNYLDPAEVSRFSAEEKRYYMNTLFASYGYRFNNSTIQRYYENQNWYSPDYSISAGNQDAIKKKFDGMCMYNYNLLK